MIAPEWMICAKGSALDRATGTVSIFEVLEGILAQGFPLFIQQLSVIVALKREHQDPETYNAQLNVTMGGQIIFEAPVDINFQGALKTKCIFTMQGVQIPSAGECVFRLSFPGLPGAAVAEFAIQVEQLPGAA
jgi:hypothetical protein